MTFNLLVVEDDADFLDALREIIAGLPGPSDVKIAMSRDEAFAALDSGFQDLVILDLKIPTVDGGLDTDPAHGHAVFARTRIVAPGTPIFILTGSSAEDFLPELLQHTQQIDIWGVGSKTGTVRFSKKYELDECPEVISEVAAAIYQLMDIELDQGDTELNVASDRLIRIFAKKFGAVRCVVSSMSGGLSGAQVVRLVLTDRLGVTLYHAVAKLGSLEEVEIEAYNYDSAISRLPPAVTPRKLATLEYGARDRAGFFLGVAEEFEETAFQIAAGAPARSVGVVQNVAAALSRWVYEVPQSRATIMQVRRRMLDDVQFGEVVNRNGLAWTVELERREIQVIHGVSHGDLHGGNILVAADNGINLIDYGDVGDGTASLDPITLELSLLFHPDGPFAGGEWPTQHQAEAWGDLGVYLENCPNPEFVQACRDWALDSAAGYREVAATAYSYLVRQLKYPDVNRDRALSLLEGVRRYHQGPN